MSARIAILSAALLAAAPLASCAAPPVTPEPVAEVQIEAVGDPCASLLACECSGACASVCGDNDCLDLTIRTDCKSCLDDAATGCAVEWAACYSDGEPLPPACDPHWPPCGVSLGCSSDLDGHGNPLPDGIYGDDGTCDDQGYTGMTCRACCYDFDGHHYAAAGCE